MFAATAAPRWHSSIESSAEAKKLSFNGLAHGQHSANMKMQLDDDQVVESNSPEEQLVEKQPLEEPQNSTDKDQNSQFITNDQNEMATMKVSCIFMAFFVRSILVV